MKKILYTPYFILLIACTNNKKADKAKTEDSETTSSASIKREITASDLLDDLYPEAIAYNINELVVPTAVTCDDFNTIERSQLRSGGNLYWTSISKDDKNKIKLFGMVGGDFSKNSKAFILDYSNHIDTTCTEGAKRIKVRLVAGLRIIYLIKDWKLNVGINGLEKIAAAKELNSSESMLWIRTIGWGQNDDAIDGLISILQNVSVKNYPEACKALIDLLDAYKTATSIKPEVIPIQ
jgi:hypothetical protein